MLCISGYVNAQCNQCGPISKVACFSDTQYFKCNALNEIDISVLTPCVTGVCSNTNPPCSVGLPPSCPGVVKIAPAPIIVPPVTPVVTVTTTTATAFCQNKPAGRYAQPGDKTCISYVYCYLNGGMMGWVYSCVGTTLFNPLTLTCESGHICIWIIKIKLKNNTLMKLMMNSSIIMYLFLFLSFLKIWQLKNIYSATDLYQAHNPEHKNSWELFQEFSL